MILSRKQPNAPPTRIVVLSNTVNTLSATKFPVCIVSGYLISHFDRTWNRSLECVHSCLSHINIKMFMRINSKNQYNRVRTYIFGNVLTRGKNIDKPRMNKFLEELRFIYCNADKPKKKNCGLKIIKFKK